MTGPFGLIVRFTLQAGTHAAFDRLVEETVTQINAREPGTLLYVCHQVAEKPEQRIFYELYQDRAAFEEHEQQDHVKRFLAEREQYISAFEVDFMTPYAGAGLPPMAG